MKLKHEKSQGWFSRPLKCYMLCGTCSRPKYTAVWLVQPVAQVHTWLVAEPVKQYFTKFGWFSRSLKCQTYGCCSLMTTERGDIRADWFFESKICNFSKMPAKYKLNTKIQTFRNSDTIQKFRQNSDRNSASI